MMKLCKIIRIITVAPLAAALAVTLLFLHGGFFANRCEFCGGDNISYGLSAACIPCKSY